MMNWPFCRVQSSDYVAALIRLDYNGLELAVGNAAGNKHKLYSYFNNHPDAVGEADFIDAVSNNLTRGRMLVLVVGDGASSHWTKVGLSKT